MNTKLVKTLQQVRELLQSAPGIESGYTVQQRRAGIFRPIFKRLQ
ncbi:hypothetical protein [Endozoicomonas euniceicola]|uniref:Uncharacterized protein n=1 Tax=Endozoicomonas euniceicola TaxID=1234143 RepID=A0ABY6GVC0_9GAMM|nr:hypothetical protein [Endozoicomonas euniceicola]UYM16715.1 hypothetical protein NX720_01915 [Endozoicomonas euniceicola]